MAWSRASVMRLARLRRPFGLGGRHVAGLARKQEGPDVVQLAEMARIRVVEEEVRAWQPQIARVVEWCQQMERVDVSGVEPLVHAGAEEERWREDRVEGFSDVGAILAMAEEKEGTYIRVPKMLDGESD